MVPSPSRRRFLHSLFAAGALGAPGRLRAAGAPPAFVPAGREFTFDTGVVRGTLRAGGASKGLIPVLDCATGTPVARSYGWFSPYRLLDDRERFGDAAWSWPSTARLRSDGAVEVGWPAQEKLPVALTAVYRWSAPHVLDFQLRAAARRTLRRFEVFLASYFEGFPTTEVPVGPAATFATAPRSAGEWQMFPRDPAAVEIIRDGRWKHGPSPVEWTVREPHALPLAVRRDAARRRAVVLMTRPEECFAVAAPYDTEVHRSVYFSLFGRDLQAGASVATRARLWYGDDPSSDTVQGLYREFLSLAARD